jgi:hypothetical protein
MSKFVVEPHFRLQEWVAEEKGYFSEEGLDYEFKELIRSTDGAHHATVGKAGAFQSIEQGRESNVTCACHWTVNVAASRGHTKLYADPQPRGSRWNTDCRRIPIGQPLCDDPSA